MENSVSTPSSDEAIIKACLKGDSSAFETLVIRHQKAMLNIALRLLGNYEDACEVVQDAFVAAYRSLSSFRGDAKFTTWLTAITLNYARNRCEQLNRRRHVEGTSFDSTLPSSDRNRSVDPPSPEPSVLERLEEEAVRRKVQECVAALASEFREVLVLRDMQEFSYEEIGVALKVQAGTVKSRLFRAREGVRECLKLTLGEL